MPFKTGTPKPANSGIKKGQKQARTIARESAFDEQMAELRALSIKYAGKDAKETMEAMEYNPVAHLILMAVAENTQDGVRQKVISELMKKHSPDLKSIEVNSREEQHIQITFGGNLAGSMSRFDKRPKASVSVVEPSQITQVVNLPDAIQDALQGVPEPSGDHDAED